VRVTTSSSTICRDEDGKVHLQERGGAGVGAAFGATAAGIIGLLAGPIILPLMLIVGGVLGGLAGHFAGQVLPPDDLRRAAEALSPGSSAYIAVVDTPHARGVAEAFANGGQACSIFR
jgi:uncharacterized membrane protein